MISFEEFRDALRERVSHQVASGMAPHLACQDAALRAHSQAAFARMLGTGDWQRYELLAMEYGGTYHLDAESYSDSSSSYAQAG